MVLIEVRDAREGETMKAFARAVRQTSEAGRSIMFPRFFENFVEDMNAVAKKRNRSCVLVKESAISR
jgi:hypothetical protein